MMAYFFSIIDMFLHLYDSVFLFGISTDVFSRFIIFNVKDDHKWGVFYVILYHIISLKVNENHPERSRHISSLSSVIDWSKLDQII